MQSNIHKLFAFSILFFSCMSSLFSQTLFWSDTFEDSGAPSSGSRSASVDFSCGSPATAYFFRTAPSGILLQSGLYSNYEGLKIWAAEDIDKGVTCTNASISALQTITWPNINISGKTGLTFRGLFAANNVNGAYQGLWWGAAQDKIEVEYQIDGGGWQRIIGFYSNDGASSASSNTFSFDSNGDYIGDGTALSYSFGEFAGIINGTGTTLGIRLTMHANAASAQEMAVDNFRLYETPACVAPSITAQPPSRTICNNSNTTFSVSATGATAYQWQVNSGAGFSNITNGGVYSNATTNTLSITGAVSAMSGYMYRCIAYSGGGVCSTTSNSSALTVITVNTNSYSQTNVACFGGNTGMASVTPGGGYGPYTYSWSPSGGTASTATGLSAGSYTVTVTDAYSCTATRNFSIIQPSQLVLNTLSQTNVSCYGASTGAASVQAASGGTAPYTYNWTPGNPTGDGSTSVTGLTAGIWTVTVTDANGCTKQQSFTITQPSQSPGADSYSLPVSNQTVVQTVNSYNYVNSSCELINAVVPSGASPVSGSVTNKVWIESGVPTHAGIPYVQRHYEITPAVNASTATGTVTLYFTQAEFDAFNAHAGSTLDLPTGPLDAAGKSNLRIGKYSGSSGDGSGMPSTYSGSAIVIDPDDAAIVWNATSNAWEVSFAVSGFSGFIVQSVSGTLPVSWASFEVLQKQTAALLLWSTTSEQDASHFVIEHSTNGSNWTQVGIVAASGNSNSTKHYQFIHQQPVKGTNVYRIQQQDLNGNVHYSVIKQLRLSMIENTVDILSNPVENGLLKILVHNRTQLISLISSSGQTVWQQQVAAGVHTIPVGAFTKGVYLLRTENRTERILIK